MNNILSGLYEWRFVLIIIGAIALYAIFEWQRFKQETFKVMLAAKKMAKDAVLKSGKEQEEWVVKKLYKLLPKSWLVFISEEKLRNIIHYLYNKAKDLADDGQLNNSI